MYIVFIVIIITSLLLFSSLAVWFASGFIEHSNPQKTKSLDRLGGYLFMSSLAVAILALLLWFTVLN
jgi:heme/copper-type cytochrome/quinol oxidase subunit 3